MALPGHRRTSSHKRRRAAHFALKPIQTTVCEKCKQPILAHRACKACGWYKGRVAIATASHRLARLAKSAHAAQAPAPASKKAPEAKAKAKTKVSAPKKAAVKAAPKSNLKKMGSGDK